MATVTDLINQSLGILGTYSIGQTPSSQDTTLAKFHLERLIETFIADSLMIPYETTDELTLVASQGSYTIGNSGSADLTTTRPDIITKAILTCDNRDYTLKIIPMTNYREIYDKTTEIRPKYMAYEPTLPDGTVYFSPVPCREVTVGLTSKKTFTSSLDFSNDLTDDCLIPNNYFPVLMYKLAYELAPHFQMDDKVMTVIVERWKTLERDIKKRNAARKVRKTSIDYIGVNQKGAWRGEYDTGFYVDEHYSFKCTLANNATAAVGMGTSFGLVLVDCTDLGKGATYRVQYQNVIDINVDPVFSSVQDNAGTINFYWDTSDFYLQNLSGSQVSLTLTFYENS